MGEGMYNTSTSELQSPEASEHLLVTLPLVQTFGSCAEQNWTRPMEASLRLESRFVFDVGIPGSPSCIHDFIQFVISMRQSALFPNAIRYSPIVELHRRS